MTPGHYCQLRPTLGDFSHRVTNSPTFEENAQLVQNKKVHFLSDISYFGSILCLRNHAPCLWSFAHYDYDYHDDLGDHVDIGSEMGMQMRVIVQQKWSACKSYMWFYTRIRVLVP